jgi:anaerobic selenocysteine-containing dehydrogenase
MMDRRRFLLTSLAGALAAPLAAEAQEPASRTRVAFVGAERLHRPTSNKTCLSGKRRTADPPLSF